MCTSTTYPTHSCIVSEVFDLEGITAYGGANLLIDFLRNDLQLVRRFEDLPMQKAAWATYSVAQDLECLLVAYCLGVERISHMPELEHDPLLRIKLGMDKLPQHSTLYRTLDRFRCRNDVESLADRNQPLLDRLIPTSTGAILDIDTTVNPVHGTQEGASVSYNPRYRGRPSYQPLIAFEGQTGAAVHIELRSGKSPNAEEKIAFYRAAKAQLPRGVNLAFVRADKAFPSEDLCTELENDGVGYTLKLRMTPRLWARLLRGVLWHRIPSDETTHIEVGIIGFRAHGWTKHRRIVLVRSRFADETQPKLFQELSWEYEAIVTNLDWPAEDIWHFYNQRCTCENHIKELKYGLNIDAISKEDFWPNAADLWVKVLAYNALLALKGLADPVTQRYSIRRLRRAVLQVPALLVRHARQLKLRLPVWWPHQGAWHQLREALNTG